MSRCECSRELSYEWLHEERVVTRSDVHLHAKCIEFGGHNGTNRRNDDAFETLPQLRFSTEGACDVSEPSNLGRACEGDRVDLAGSHFGNDSHHARIVGFRSVDIWKHGVRCCAGVFEEFQKSLIRIAGIQLHADATPGKVMPFQCRDNAFSRGFVGGQSDFSQRAHWFWSTRDLPCLGERETEGGFQLKALGEAEEPP